MIKITVDDNTKKEYIDSMSAGDVFICDDKYYMYIDSYTIVRLPDFSVWDFNDFPEGEYIICNAEIIIHR